MNKKLTEVQKQIMQDLWAKIIYYIQEGQEFKVEKKKAKEVLKKLSLMERKKLSQHLNIKII